MTLDAQHHSCTTNGASSTVVTETVQMVSSCEASACERPPSMPKIVAAATMITPLKEPHGGACMQLPALSCAHRRLVCARRQQLLGPGTSVLAIGLESDGRKQITALVALQAMPYGDRRSRAKHGSREHLPGLVGKPANYFS